MREKEEEERGGVAADDEFTCDQWPICAHTHSLTHLLTHSITHLFVIRYCQWQQTSLVEKRHIILSNAFCLPNFYLSVSYTHTQPQTETQQI